MKYIKLFEEFDNQLLAPNGKPSNLNEIQYNLVRTNEFKNWFGDWESNITKSSKTLDSNGEPCVFYHSSTNNFTIFDLNAEKKNRTNNFAGFYFTNDKDYALNYPHKGYIYECFLNIRNPLIYRNGYSSHPSSKAIKYIENKYKNKYSDDYLREKINKLKGGSWWVSLIDGNDSTQMAMIDGLDGYFDGGSDVCVFSPNNIKLADGSNITFNKNNPDITK